MSKYSKVLSTIVIVLAILIAGLFVYGQFFIKNPLLYDYYCVDYKSTWVNYKVDGTTEEFVAPYEVEVPDGVPVTISTVLPNEIREDTYMFVRTGRSFAAYIDDEERFDYNAEDIGIPGVAVKSFWIPIDLKASDAGKTLVIQRYGTVGFNGNVNEVYIANMSGFYYHLLRENAFIMILSVYLLILCLVTLAFGVVYLIRSKEVLPPMHLVIGVGCASLWLIFDNYTYSFLMHNYNIDGVMEYLILLLLPYPFSQYINATQKRRYQTLINVLNTVLIVAFAIFTALHFMGIENFNTTALMSNVVLIAYIAALVAVSIYDIFYRKNYYYYTIAIGFLCFIILAVIEVIHVNLEYHYNDGIYLAIGLFVLLLFTCIHEVFKLVRLQRESFSATQSNKAKSEFLANMSHEIRTPINAIMGFNELLMREPVTDTVLTYSENIKAASETLLETVNGILDFSKIEQGRMELVEEEYDLSELLYSVIAMCKVKADQKNLAFKTNISVELPRMLFGDRKHIKETMINILNNAIKYTPEGTVTLSVYCKEIDEKNITLIYKVKDTGIGIKDEDKDRIFNNFERLDLKKNRSVEGSGLGLAICKGLVDLMGGKIVFDSTYGHGTTFTVRIPQSITTSGTCVDLDEYAASLAQREKKREGRIVFPDAEILVVDDNQLNLMVAQGLIGRSMANVTSVSSGKEMLEVIAKKRFDLIFLDHMMPEMDGIETMERARKQTPNKSADSPYIALTANAINGAREYYLENGFVDYLSKPIDSDKLEELLVTFLPKEKMLAIDENANIDENVGMKYCSGMKDFYADTLRLFNELAEERIGMLDEAKDKGDIEGYRIVIHSVKSNALTIGATALSGMAKQLEECCKAKDFESVIAEHESMKKCYRQVAILAEGIAKKLG